MTLPRRNGMKKPTVFALVLLLLIVSCTEQTKKIKQDVPGKDYVLKEELSIGDEGDEHSLFAGIVDFAVDDEGDIYVLEARTKEVRVFNKAGEFIRAFSKKGEGPGETIVPWNLSLDDNTKMAYIVDWRKKKISRYHFNGEFDSDLNLKHYSPIALTLDSNGNYIIVCLIQKNDKKDFQDFFRLVKMTPEGNVLKESSDFFYDRYQMIEEGDYGYTYYAPFRPGGFLYFNNGSDYFYYGVSDKYEFKVFDKDFNPVKIIKKLNAVPEEVTEADKKDYTDAHLKKGKRKKKLVLYKKIATHFKFPAHHPLFVGLWEDDEKRLLVNSFTRENEAHVDVFNAEGVYMEKMIVHDPGGTIEFESIFDSATIFRHGYIYATVYENDNLVIKKFRLVERE